MSAAAGTLIGTPQTISIAVGAGLITVLDYRLLLATMATVIAGAAVYLFTRTAEAASPAGTAAPLPDILPTAEERTSSHAQNSRAQVMQRFVTGGRRLISDAGRLDGAEARVHLCCRFGHPPALEAGV